MSAILGGCGCCDCCGTANAICPSPADTYFASGDIGLLTGTADCPSTGDNDPVAIDWSDFGSPGTAITLPATIDVGPGIVTVTLSSAAGVAQVQEAVAFNPTNFCVSPVSPLCRFWNGTNHNPTAGPVTMEFDPPVCYVRFAVSTDYSFAYLGITYRDDFYIHVWTDDSGSTTDEGTCGSLIVDNSVPSANSAPVYGATIQCSTTKRISKIEFGFAGSMAVGVGGIPFYIDNVGMCPWTPPSLTSDGGDSLLTDDGISNLLAW